MGRQKIRDEFTDLALSRQRKWQLRRSKAGLCFICGARAVPGSSRCLSHLVSNREKQRKGSGIRYKTALSYQAEAAAAEGRPFDPELARHPKWGVASDPGRRLMVDC